MEELLHQIRQEVISFDQEGKVQSPTHHGDGRSPEDLYLISCSSDPYITDDRDGQIEVSSDVGSSNQHPNMDKIHVREYFYRYLQTHDYGRLMQIVGINFTLNKTEAMVIAWYILTYGIPRISTETMMKITSVDQLYQIAKKIFTLTNKTVAALVLALLYGIDVKETCHVKIDARDAWNVAYSLLGKEMRERTQSPYYCVENIRSNVLKRVLPVCKLRTIEEIKNYLYVNGWVNPWEIGCISVPRCTFLRILRYAGGRISVDTESDSALVSYLDSDDQTEVFNRLAESVAEDEYVNSDPDNFGFRVAAHLRQILEQSSEYSDSDACEE
jgi:hypothetical protein